MKLGCQARSFGKGIYPNEADFLAVVRQIGNLYFKGLEANWKNLERYFQDPEAFKRILAETDLELIGAHYGAAHWDESSREQIGIEGNQIAILFPLLADSTLFAVGGVQHRDLRQM